MRGYRCPADHGCDVMQMPVNVFRLILHANLGRPKPFLLHRFRHEPAIGKAEGGDCSVQGRQIDPRINEGP
jgi:hypothetical protein